MTPTVHYIFDPLCGWCYGAGPALAALAATPEVTVRLQPSGLFSEAGARPMDDDFAGYAWSNDQRIERLTGQPFSERYRDQVLADRHQRFDSGPATLALTAVALTAPQREADALKAIQQARYVEGRDITDTDTLATLLESLGLEDAAARLRQPDLALLSANQQRVAQAQAMLRQAGAGGVPTFVLERDGQRQVLHSGAAFSDPQAFVAQLTAGR
ncbi:DsbA family protein [Xenophilus aerolatus]|nr:DsbA family protein [Xenophilus aerolatus]